jgi:hypothetical protein
VTKPPRSALPLPRYVERKPLKTGGWGYFFHVPSWARTRVIQARVRSNAVRVAGLGLLGTPGSAQLLHCGHSG